MVYLNKIKITMIKKYKIFKESLLNHLEGPSEEEIWNNIKDTSPYNILLKSLGMNYFYGVKYALNKNISLEGLGRSTIGKLLNILYENGEKDIVYKYINNIGKLDSYRYFYSCMYGYLDGVKDWFSNPVNINRNNYNGLELAIKYNQQEIVEYIINRFESTQYAYEWESRAKDYAYRYNNRGVLDFFLYRGY